MQDRICLCGDIGGTHSRLGLAGPKGLLPDSLWHGANDDFPDFGAVLQAYLTGRRPRPDQAVLAIAGPVQGRRARLTNRDWAIDAVALADMAGLADIALINDLAGLALGVDAAPDAARQILRAGQAAPDAPVLVVGIGTGFNTATLSGPITARRVAPAEAGHAALPAQTAADRDLLTALARDLSPVTIEDALSRRGLAHLHRIWSGDPRPLTPRDLTPGLDDPAIRQTLLRLARLLGQVLGDLVLHHLALGGVVLSGGVAQALSVPLQDPAITAELSDGFLDKGRYRSLLTSVPITLLDDRFAALRGCTAYAKQCPVSRS